jgi:hypothetical protein
VVLSVLLLLLGQAAGSACSPPKACDFVKKLNVSKKGESISLLCDPEEACTISGVRLGAEHGVVATVDMTNVLVQNNDAITGGLLEIGPGGTVKGTNVTFANGTCSDDGFGGCVLNLGTFVCTDCVFDKCDSGSVGGGVMSFDTATLELVRPAFIDSTCKPVSAKHKGPCGSGCACGGHNMSKCVGCTCQIEPGDGFYCNSNTSV